MGYPTSEDAERFYSKADECLSSLSDRLGSKPYMLGYRFAHPTLAAIFFGAFARVKFMKEGAELDIPSQERTGCG